MKRWEYRILQASIDGNPDSEFELNELGKACWELVTVREDARGDTYWYFKRPVSKSFP